MARNVVFIHGMFQNNKSWARWKTFFEQRNYNCIVESWPLHTGEPTDLRNNIPEGLGKLRLKTVVDQFELIAQSVTDPILIGHSMGGLIVQLLINQHIGTAGVCITSAPPNRMLALDWGLLKNSISIANPFAGDDPFLMSPEWFHQNLANTMSKESSDKACEATSTHDSRYIVRDCLLADGHVDIDLPHKPLLFIGAEKDELIPPGLNQKNVKAYSDKSSLIAYKEFQSRGHFICGEPGWEEVAEYIYKWLEENVH